MENSVKDIIIGGGVSGLSFARFDEGHEYLVLEKDSSIGGYARTTKRNGFVWDYSGHFFHFQDPEIEKMVAENMCSDNILTISKTTHIKYKDRLIDFPFQKNIHQLQQDEFIDCLYDLFTAPKDAYQTFKEMLYSKFGRSIAEKFLIPYNSKLYACDLDRLDKDAMGRFFPYASPEEIVRNFRNQNNTSYNGSFEYPKGGAIEYVNSISSGIIQSNIITNTKVTAINPQSHTVTLDNGKTLNYARLISTIPFVKMMDMTGMDFDKDAFTWNKVLVFNLGFERKGPNTSDHWIYFPEGCYCFYRVGFYDNILGQDRMSLYVELGFDKDATIDADNLLDRVLSDLKTAGILQDDNRLVDHEVILMDPAYVHINNRSQQHVAQLKSILAAHDIYSIGRYGSWTYCSIEDNIKEARTLAQTINKKH
ncbi:MAG: FAD-dependent oxidoreductase [Bacteroidales bacterium]|nr:FAD-dependent oxidoreductase [Bacteroidales bacterium]